MLSVVGQQQPLATTVVGAFDSVARRRGLLGRTGMASDEAIIIAPCNAVHTFGMQFAIDVIYTARDGTVVKVFDGLKPWRISAAWSAFAVIEMAAGTVRRHDLRSGSRIELR